MVRFRRHHLVRAHAAARLLNPQMLRLPAEDLDEAEQPFPDPAQARAWLNAEYANLLALVHERTGGGANAAVFRLADAMRGFLWLRYDLPQWVGVASAALAAAEEAVDDHAIVSAQISLAQALHCCGEYRAGVEMYERALVRAGAIGWTQAQATAIGNSAVIWLGLGEQRRCIRYCRESIALYRDLGQRSGEAVNVGTMGLAYLIGGELRQARRRLSAAAQLHRGLHTDSMLVMSLCHLGETCRQIGEHERAGALLAEALELAQRIGARSAESVASHYRAALHLDRAETAEAEAWARRSLAISEETGNSFASAYANVVLGMAHRHAGRFADAIDCHQRALAFARSSHERHPEVCALNALAETMVAEGEFTSADGYAGLARELATQAQYRNEQARAMLTVARVRLGQNQPAPAQALARNALALLRRTGQRPGTLAAEEFLRCLRRSPAPRA
jgi:tetratricopeptide (TPR) repeat protein